RTASRREIYVYKNIRTSAWILSIPSHLSITFKISIHLPAYNTPENKHTRTHKLPAAPGPQQSHTHHQESQPQSMSSPPKQRGRGRGGTAGGGGGGGGGRGGGLPPPTPPPDPDTPPMTPLLSAGMGMGVGNEFNMGVGNWAFDKDYGMVRCGTGGYRWTWCLGAGLRIRVHKPGKEFGGPMEDESSCYISVDFGVGIYSTSSQADQPQ
ncbi:hypothetical protein F4779DRAFT_633735, partial [Xylariaceae sp. FL0662B]